MPGHSYSGTTAELTRKSSGREKGTLERVPLVAKTVAGLDAKGGAATAGALDGGVLELEAGGFEGLDVVDDTVGEVHGGGGVEEDLEVVELVDLVHHAALVLEGH